jgi:ankyrin repeat protein
MLQVLLDRGINVNAQDNTGKTAIALLILNHPMDSTLGILINHGADLNLPDFGIQFKLFAFLYFLSNSFINADGYSPLHLAAKANERELVYFLLRLGADCMAITNDGKSVLDFILDKTARTIFSHQYALSEMNYIILLLTIHLAFPKKNISPFKRINQVHKLQCSLTETHIIDV